MLTGYTQLTFQQMASLKGNLKPSLSKVCEVTHLINLYPFVLNSLSELPALKSELSDLCPPSHFL